LLYNKENKKNVFPTVSLNCRLAILLANPPLWLARCGERLRSEKRRIRGSLGPSRPPRAKSPSTSRQNCIPPPRAAMYRPPRPRPEEGRRSQPLPRLGEKRRRDGGTVGTGAEQGKVEEAAPSVYTARGLQLLNQPRMAFETTVAASSAGTASSPPLELGRLASRQSGRRAPPWTAA
jgi:hypothetical protein